MLYAHFNCYIVLNVFSPFFLTLSKIQHNTSQCHHEFIIYRECFCKTFFSSFTLSVVFFQFMKCFFLSFFQAVIRRVVVYFFFKLFTNFEYNRNATNIANNTMIIPKNVRTVSCLSWNSFFISDVTLIMFKLSPLLL